MIAASNDVVGSISTIADTATTFMSDLDDALINSDTSGDVQVVATRNAFRIDYDEATGNNDKDIHLDLLRESTDGSMDSIHELRDYDKADIVALLVDDGPCGVSYLDPDDDYAFMVVDIDCVDFTFAHEVGHIFGGSHNPEENPDPAYPYGHGYQDPSEEFRTVMAYDCENGCDRIAHYSNPDVLYSSKVTGTMATHDVDRVIEERAATVAAFRTGSYGSTHPVPTVTSKDMCYGLNQVLWDEVASATTYQVYRSDSPVMSGARWCATVALET